MFLGDEEHPEVDEWQGDVEPQDAEHIEPPQAHASCGGVEDSRLHDPANEMGNTYNMDCAEGYRTIVNGRIVKYEGPRYEFLGRWCSSSCFYFSERDIRLPLSYLTPNTKITNKQLGGKAIQNQAPQSLILGGMSTSLTIPLSRLTSITGFEVSTNK